MKMIKNCCLTIATLCISVMMCGCGDDTEKNRANCVSHLKQFGTALVQYESAYSCFPTQGLDGMEVLRKEYMDAPKCYICPSSKDVPCAEGDSIDDYHNCSYIYLGSEKLRASEQPKFPVIIEKPQNHKDSIGVLFLDSDAVRVQTKEKSAVKFLQTQFKNGEGFDPENWKIALEAAAKWDKENGF